MIGSRLLLVAALLSGCGGGGGDDMAVPDMAMSLDMPGAPADMAMHGDMISPTTAQLTLTDVVGTFYVPGMALPQTHVLLALASFPAFSNPSQYTDADYSQTPGSLHGCYGNRYDQTTDGGAHPTPNSQAGNVTLSGYDYMHLAGGDALGNSGSPAAQIVCVNPDNSYSCYFGGPPGSDGGTGGINNESTNAVLFPVLPPSSLPAGAPCDSTIVGSGMCEQHPIPLGGATNIIEDVAGGVEFGAVPNRQISSVPDGISVTSITGGGATATASKKLDDIVLDPTQDLVITWTCPDVGGCPVNFVDVMAGLIVVSTNARDNFAFTPQYGQATCLEQSSANKVTLHKEAIAAILGSPKQTGGSVLFALTRLRINLAGTNGHTVYLTAGHGVYGFATIP